MTQHFDWPESVSVTEPQQIVSDSGVLALMDVAAVGEVWADLLYDGAEHEHADGGLMYHSGAFGTHLSMPGYTTVNVAYNAYGLAVGFDVDLDPYDDELPVEFHDHHHGPADGWTDEISVFVPSDAALFGDPVGVDEADGTGGLVELNWPSVNGLLRVAVRSEGGVRKSLRAHWEQVN